MEKKYIEDESTLDLKILKGKGIYILLEDNEGSYFLIGDPDFESFNNKKIPYPDFDKEWLEKYKKDLKFFAQYTEFKTAEKEFEKYGNNDFIISYKNNKENEKDKQIIEAESLPKGWDWVQYDDESGYLKSPNGQRYFSYDCQTNEFQITEKEHYNIYGGKFTDFKKYAENYIFDNVIIKIGEKYPIQNGIDTPAIVIEYKNRQALLKNLSKDNPEYIVANGITINKDDKLEWLNGSYYQDLSIAARRFEARTSDYIKDINTLKELLNEEAHDKYIEAVISNELRNGFLIEKEEKEILDKVYDDYMDINDIKLFSEEIYTLFHEKNREIENEEILDS